MRSNKVTTPSQLFADCSSQQHARTMDAPGMRCQLQALRGGAECDRQRQPAALVSTTAKTRGRSSQPVLRLQPLAAGWSWCSGLGRLETRWTLTLLLLLLLLLLKSNSRL